MQIIIMGLIKIKESAPLTNKRSIIGSAADLTSNADNESVFGNPPCLIIQRLHRAMDNNI